MPRNKPEERSPARGRGERLTGIHCVREALRAQRRRLVRLRVGAGDQRPELAELVAAAENAGIEVEAVPPEAIGARASREGSGQGVELEAGPLPEVLLEELTAAASPPRTLVALDGVEDPQNLGAIARVAEASGVSGLILTRRRSPPLSPAVARASAGAIEWLPVARVPNLPRALNQLKKNNFWVFGSDPGATDELFGVPDRLLRGDRVLVLGAEGRGLRRGIEQVLDHRIRIPMQGHVGSLNVAAAAAVLLFEFQRRGRLATSP